MARAEGWTFDPMMPATDSIREFRDRYADWYAITAAWNRLSVVANREEPFDAWEAGDADAPHADYRRDFTDAWAEGAPRLPRTDLVDALRARVDHDSAARLWSLWDLAPQVDPGYVTYQIDPGYVTATVVRTDVVGFASLAAAVKALAAAAAATTANVGVVRALATLAVIVFLPIWIHGALIQYNRRFDPGYVAPNHAFYLIMGAVSVLTGILSLLPA